MTGMPDTSIKDFEAAIAELESIVKKLEDGDLALEPSLALYERGVRLVFVQGGSGLQFAAVVEDFDAPLSVLETRMAEPRQLDAALVECQGRLEREIAVFQFLDD